LNEPTSGSVGSSEQKTLRQSFRVSIGGSKVRIRLSNVFGQEPLTIGDVHIARAASDKAIFIDSDKNITFHGQHSVTIPPGESVVSDMVRFKVVPLSDVTVRLYLPAGLDNERITEHSQANPNIFLAAGDVSGSPSIAPAATLTSYYFLTNLDVWNNRTAGAVVALGASITDSSNSSFGANLRWTNLLAKRLHDSGAPPVGVLNEGISASIGTCLHRRTSDGSSSATIQSMT
jgi:hypothetical protein